MREVNIFPIHNDRRNNFQNSLIDQIMNKMISTKSNTHLIPESRTLNFSEFVLSIVRCTYVSSPLTLLLKRYVVFCVALFGIYSSMNAQALTYTVTTSFNNTVSTSHNISIPSGNQGDLIIVLYLVLLFSLTLQSIKRILRLQVLRRQMMLNYTCLTAMV